MRSPLLTKLITPRTFSEIAVGENGRWDPPAPLWGRRKSRNLHWFRRFYRECLVKLETAAESGQDFVV